MHQQSPMFNVNDNHGTITFSVTTPTLSPTGKCDKDQNVKVDVDIMKWLDDIASATGGGRSTVARDAILFYRFLYPVHRKILRYQKAIVALLDKLP